MGARIPIRRSRAARLARAAGTLSLPVLALTALLRRAGLVPLDALIPLVALGVGLGLAAVLLGAAALARIWHTGDLGARSASIGILYALPALVLLGLVAYGFLAHPTLADISTDLADPPGFSSVEPPPPAFLPADEAQLQAAAYPDIGARVYDLDVERVFSAVRELVRARGWEASLVDPPATLQDTGRIEATARTFLFQFPDLVSIRVAATPDGARVDMRSTSGLKTLGDGDPVHDLGQNARRIRSFLADLDAFLAGDLTTEAEEPQRRDIPRPRPTQ